ncbi:unnamed protein product [Microthlaspi erraticum]|uniref:Uncharacterized protein n=1 Tax=Microthlaspi erraticum TaxID=1685480 RepID=A0A6D2L1J2_9BRAS|nr:unnamed protein product [Microthlaspi erraticum]
MDGAPVRGIIIPSYVHKLTQTFFVSFVTKSIETLCRRIDTCEAVLDTIRSDLTQTHKNLTDILLRVTADNSAFVRVSSVDLTAAIENRCFTVSPIRGHADMEDYGFESIPMRNKRSKTLTLRISITTPKLQLASSQQHWQREQGRVTRLLRVYSLVLLGCLSTFSTLMAEFNAMRGSDHPWRAYAYAFFPPLRLEQL